MRNGQDRYFATCLWGPMGIVGTGTHYLHDCLNAWIKWSEGEAWAGVSRLYRVERDAEIVAIARIARPDRAGPEARGGWGLTFYAHATPEERQAVIGVLAELTDNAAAVRQVRP